MSALPGGTAVHTLGARDLGDGARAGLRAPVPAVFLGRADMATERVRTIVAKYRDARGGLISMLDEIQAKSGYLSEPDLRAVASLTGRALTDIYGVATFYKAFRLQPRGLLTQSVWHGVPVRVRRGAARVRAAAGARAGAEGARPRAMAPSRCSRCGAWARARSVQSL
jgi:hypothetical protein